MIETLEYRITHLQAAMLSRIQSAKDLAGLEQARVVALGRKGELALIGNELRKLPADERARTGKLLNDVKQMLTIVVASESGL